MSAAPLNAASQTTTTQAGSGTQGAAASAGAHKGQKGPPTGFDALLAMLSAAQDGAADMAAVPKGASKTVVKTVDAAGKTKDGKAVQAEGDKTSDDGNAAAAGAASTAASLALLVPAAPPVVTTTILDPAKGDAVAGSLNGQAPGGASGKGDAASLAAALAKDADATATADATPAPATDSKLLNIAKLDLPVAKPLDTASAAKTDLAGVSPAQPAAVDTNAAAKVPPGGAPVQTPPQTAAQAAPEAPAPAAAPVAAVAADGAALTASAAQAANPSVTPPAPVSSKDRNALGKAVRVDGVRTAPAAASAGAISTKMAQGVQSQAQADLAVADATPDEAGAAVAEADVQAQADTATPAPQTGPDLNTAASATATPAAVAHAATVEVRSQPQTVAALAAQIVKKLDGRSTHFDVALDPIGLGHVNVRVEIGATGKMTAALAFDSPQAAAELRGRASELQDAMKQAGFDLSGGLSFDVASDRGQGAPSQDNQPSPTFRGRAFQSALDTAGDPPASGQFSFRRSSASGVDIRI